MAAKKGNKNAVGNKGGRPYSKENREKAVKIKGLVLDYIGKVMTGKDEELKKQIVLKIATVCFPQEITGEGGEVIKITFDKAFNQKNDTSRKTKRDSQG
jgi:hypothetical protein